MNSFLLILIICLIKLIESCTTHPAPASCSSRTIIATTTINGAAYCRCNSCPLFKAIDSLLISCCTSPSNCVTCLGSSIGSCTQCVTGFAVVGSGCQSCGSLMTNCILCSASTVCTSCVSPSYALNGSSCPLCSDFLPNCTTCSSKTTCTQCLNTSFAVNLTNCALCSSLMSLCVTCSSAITCTQCVARAYLKANQLCQMCSAPISYCISCYLNAINNSVTCTKCDSFHTVDPISGYCLSCQSVMTACLACYSNDTHCKACAKDTYSIDYSSLPQNCQFCNATLTYCYRCLNISLCIQCIADPTIFLYRLINFTATNVSGGFYKINSYTGPSGDCRFCNISYAYCVTCNSSQCLTCTANLSITFVAGYYCDLCQNILFACDGCYTEFECFKCRNAYFTLVATGPTSRVCKFCCDMMVGCLLCSTPTVCTTCSVGYPVLGGCSASAGCLQVIQTGPRAAFCSKCEPIEFNPTPVNGICMCKEGHVAGKYCTTIIGCQVISRSILADTCTSCDSMRHFVLIGGKCPCIDHYSLSGDSCDEICGDGLVLEDECDDGNTFDLDGCSSNCKVEKKYICYGGSSTTPSICRLTERIHISISEIIKESNSNSLQLVLRVSHPTRHLMLINYSSALQYTPKNLLELSNIQVDAEFVKLSFKYFQDVPQILAKVLINLDPKYFIQAELRQQYLLKASSEEVLYYDKWAGSNYSEINHPIFYLGIVALLVSIIGSISYKMIGVETLHTFQLIFMGMVFSRRYSNYFHSFGSLSIPFGQSSTLLASSKLQIQHRLAFMKYSNIFESNIIIIGGAFTLLFLIFLIANILKHLIKYKIKRSSKKNSEILADKVKSIERFRLNFKQYILLPLALGFFYHILLSIIFQSYKLTTNKGVLYSVLITFFKMGLVSSFSWIIFDEVKRAFITLLKFNPDLKYRGTLHFAQPLLPYEPKHMYPPLFVVLTIIIGAYTAASILLKLKYYIQVNLILSAIRILYIATRQPYQFKFHNISVLFNSIVVFLAFTWLTLEEFYLCHPIMTNIMAILMFSCLAAVLVLAILRVIYNIWIKYKKTLPENDQDQEKKLQETINKKSTQKTEMEQLLSKQINRVGRQIDTQKIGWKKKGMFKPEQNQEKKKRIEEFIKKSKQTLSLNMKSRRNRETQAIN